MTEKEYWDIAAQDPDVKDKYICDPLFRTEDFLKIIEESINDFFQKEVVEIGCGIGRLIHPLAEKWKSSQFYGLDISDLMIAQAPISPNLKYQLVPKMNSIDLVYSMLVFQHMSQAEKFANLDFSRRLLKQNGTLVFQFVIGESDVFVNHQTDVLTMSQMVEQNGFIINSVDIGKMHPDWCFIKATRA